MKISESQLRKIVKEEISKLKEVAYKPGRAVGRLFPNERGPMSSADEQPPPIQDPDEWVNPAEGMTDDEIYAKVNEAIRQIESILEDVHELATYSPDNRNKGEGQALANLVHSIDHWHDTYGSGDKW